MSAGIEIAGAAPASTNQARAAASSFYAGMRLMPRPERQAMFAIYAFSRAVDDVADEGDAPPAERRAALDAWRADIEALYQGMPVARADFLLPVIARYRPRKEDFLAVIDGMEMDAAEDIRAPDLAKLDCYCDRVASAVGRLSIKVFGMDEGPGFELAHHLGRALQLTNILRDLDEDAAAGRLYLPREILDASGIASGDPRSVVIHPAIDAACRSVAMMAHAHYRAANRVMQAGPRGRLRAPRLMGAVYARLLAKMERTGWAPPRRRASLGKGELIIIVLRHGLHG
jgi:presqualene diphosphate synthase